MFLSTDHEGDCSGQIDGAKREWEGRTSDSRTVIVDFAGSYGHYWHVRADLTYAWGGAKEGSWFSP